jgi:hypothetical protein
MFAQSPPFLSRKQTSIGHHETFRKVPEVRRNASQKLGGREERPSPHYYQQTTTRTNSTAMRNAPHRLMPTSGAELLIVSARKLGFDHS